MMEKKIIDDFWTFHKVGTPFPANVQKAPGQANQYVALWYKHGKPVMGKAWNDSGVVQCSFYIDNRVYRGHDVGGQIQLLVRDSNSTNRAFCYDWVVYKKAKILKSEGKCEFVRCGNNSPVFWPELEVLGNLDSEKEVAQFIVDGGNIKSSREISDFMILCKMDENANREQPQKYSKMPLIVNDWEDINWGSAWPENKPLMAPPNGKNEQFVALWYRHGKPIMGRAWSKKGKVEASFSDASKEFTGASVGSLQLLVRLPPTAVGYDYVWKTYEQASDYQDKDFLPVHLSHVCPALIPVEGVEYLGMLDMKTEKAAVGVNGKIYQLEGGQVKGILVLCRKEHQETVLV